MKNAFLGTTALVAASFLATNATAAEWDISMGGYFNGSVSATSIDDDFGQDPNEIDFATDSVIEFQPSITLDNGLTFGARIEIEPEQNSDVNDDADLIDEVWVYARGGFGEVQVGQTDSVGRRLSVAIPNIVGHSVNGNDEGAMDPFASYDVYTGLQWTSLRNRINTDLGFTDDAIRINYISPSMNGFRAGASYTPNPGKNDTGYGDYVQQEFGRDYFEFAGRLDWEINNVLFLLFGGVGIGDRGDSRNEPFEWSIGSSLQFGGLKLYGTYTEHDTEYEYYNGDLFNGTVEQWTLASQYNTGPWRFDLQTGQNDGDNHVRDSYSWGDYRVEDQYDSYMGGLTYEVGPGFEVGGGVRVIQFDNDTHGEFVDNRFSTDASSVFIGSRLSF